MLLPPADATTPEAILALGQWGSGKTEDWAGIAAAYRKHGNTGHFHVICTEYERVLASMQGRPGWADNTTVYECESWDDVVGAAQTIKMLVGARCEANGWTRLTSQDWLVVDVVGNPHLWARDAWFDRKHPGKSYRQFQDEGGTAAQVESHEWRQMDRIYLGEWFNPYVTRFPGHVFLCAQSEPFAEGAWAPKSGSTIKETFGRLRQKPVGHKELARAVHTVIYKVSPEQGVFKMTVLKDKPTRELVEAEQVLPLSVGGFVSSYLLGHAGWRTDGTD